MDEFDFVSENRVLSCQLVEQILLPLHVEGVSQAIELLQDVELRGVLPDLALRVEQDQIGG